jgi:fructokinase
MFDIYGLGNALVDEVHQVEDSFLRRHKIAKGYMTLVEESRIDALIHDLQQSAPERMSGGSAANTAYAAQGFGARAFYSCKVTNDPTGTHFLGDLAAAGIATNRNAATGLGKSGRCLILVTPDAERTMNTFLGVSSELSEADIDEAALATSRYFYVEGYLSSSPSSLAAAIECRELAERRGVKTAVSLSDPSMIQFFRDNLGQILLPRLFAIRSSVVRHGRLRWNQASLCERVRDVPAGTSRRSGHLVAEVVRVFPRESS